jgi:hypothetical protein
VTGSSRNSATRERFKTSNGAVISVPTCRRARWQPIAKDSSETTKLPAEIRTQIVSSGCEGEDPSHFEDSRVPNLPQQRDRLQPVVTCFMPGICSSIGKTVAASSGPVPTSNCFTATRVSTPSLPTPKSALQQPRRSSRKPTRSPRNHITNGKFRDRTPRLWAAVTPILSSHAA